MRHARDAKVTGIRNQCVLCAPIVLIAVLSEPSSAQASNWVTAAPLLDRTVANRAVLRRAKYPVVYICSVDDTTDALGHLTVSRYVALDGRFTTSAARWDGGAYNNQMPIGGMLRLGAIWRSAQNGDLDIPGGQFQASWEMSPPVGTVSNRPEAFFVDGRGTRLALPSTWPEKYNKPRIVTAWVNWGGIAAAAMRPGDLVFTVQARNMPVARRMSIDSIIPKIANAVGRMEGLVKDGAKTFRSRCQATEQTPVD